MNTFGRTPEEQEERVKAFIAAEANFLKAIIDVYEAGGLAQGHALHIFNNYQPYSVESDALFYGTPADHDVSPHEQTARRKFAVQLNQLLAHKENNA